MNEEEIKKRLLMQRLQEQQATETATAAAKEASRHLLDEKARQRLNNVRAVNPELASTLEMYIAQAYQAGQLRHRLTEADVISILKRITPKKDFRIRRK